MGLRHVGESFCEVDEGLAAVGLVEEEDGEVWADVGGVGVGGGGDGWFVGGDGGGAEAEGWFEGGGAVVGC